MVTYIYVKTKYRFSGDVVICGVRCNVARIASDVKPLISIFDFEISYISTTQHIDQIQDFTCDNINSGVR